jgi:hypothetical protein
MGMIMDKYDFRQNINEINFGINVILPRILLGIDDRFKSNYNTSTATNPLPIINKFVVKQIHIAQWFQPQRRCNG